MQWAAIFAALWQVFGPVVNQLIQQLISKWFNKAAAQLGDAAQFPDEVTAQAAAIDKTLTLLPRWAFARKALLHRMKAKLGQPLTPADVAEFQNLSAAVDEE